MKVSVITAVFNNRRYIGACIQSVLSQTYKDIEHIIIDGGSTDGTLDVIKAGKRSEAIGDGQKVMPRPSPLTPHLSPITRLISEPDDGIYDALNKGIAVATGDVIGFLHADDVYAHNRVVETVARAIKEHGAESCYGDLEYVRDSGQADNRGEGSGVRGEGPTQNSKLITHNFEVVRYWKSGPFERGLFRKGWMPPHPTFFVRTGVYNRFGKFNTEFRIAADYELMLRFLWKGNISVCYIPEVLIRMSIGGTSNGSIRNVLRKSVEDYRAMRMHGAGGLTTLLRKNISKLPQFLSRHDEKMED